MQIEITRKFRKLAGAYNDLALRSKILSIIEAVSVSDNMQDFPNLKKTNWIQELL